ncbi:hypothetical protein RCF98_11700 [Thiothrix lacustris]|uniref:t-SNARE coiled-coil homology domain-containing protein n=1 Tax=Thiothrix lacustris TaxID=525917 RepID=A0ABY9MLW5_9GAMM|nr:hypothetical protein [Thiothrix lacustris]WML89633.1 hypothetical protein RCF98_11700 [Thiothrix lacustris]
MNTNDTSSGTNNIGHELHDVEDELQQFEERQVNVTRTLQMIVYPAMVAFIILSAYGFYLVQSLTTDVHTLTQTISDMNRTVDTNMGRMSGNLDTMTGQMGHLVQSTGEMTHNIVGMNSSTQDMAGNMQQMNASTQNMAVSTYNMQRDMWSMNKNISGPMKMFNKFSPFGNDNTSPYVVPPPAVATPYYNYYTLPQSGVTQPPLSPPTAAMIPVQPAVGVLPPAAIPQPIQPSDAETAKDGHSSVDKDGDQFVAMMIKG